MGDLPFNNLIYVIPTNRGKPIKVIFENLSDNEKESDCNYIIGVVLSKDVDMGEMARSD